MRGSINVDYLREFTMLAHYSSFTKAAQAMHISQPALSNHIAALEKEAGVTLVCRGGQETSLTSIGAAWLEDVNAALAQVDGLLPKLQRLKGFTPSRITVDAYKGHTYVEKLLRATRDNLHRANPLFEVTVQAIDHFDVLGNIQNGKSDLCLILDNRPIHAPLKAKTIGATPLVAVAERNSALGQNDHATIADLEGMTVLVPGTPNDHAYSHKVRELLGDRGVSVSVEEVYFSSEQNLFDLDLHDKVLFDTAYACETMTPAQAETHRIIPFEEPSFTLDVLAVFHEDNDNPGLPDYLEALQSAIAKI